MILCEKETKPITNTNKQKTLLMGQKKVGTSRVRDDMEVYYPVELPQRRQLCGDQLQLNKASFFLKLQTNSPERHKDVFYFKLVNLW